MDLRKLRYFVAVAETLHFGRAAQRLNIAQPPLSHQIRVLERELGAALFDRSNRRVELTPAGQALLPEARSLLAQAERTSGIAARVQRGEIGELRIGFTSAAALIQVIPRLIFEYRQKWPEVNLRIEERTTQEQLAAMLDRRLDFAFGRDSRAPVLPASLRAIRLIDDPLVVALPPRHRLARGSGPIPVGALADERFVMFPRDSGTAAYAQIVSLCRAAGFAPRVAQEARTAVTMMGLVAAGLGVALVPGSFRSIGAKGLAYRTLREPEARSSMWLVSRVRNQSLQERRFQELASGKMS